MQKLTNFVLILVLGLAVVHAISEFEVDPHDPKLLKQIVDGVISIDVPVNYQSDMVVARLHSLEDGTGVAWSLTQMAKTFPWLITHIPRYLVRSVELIDPNYILVLYSDFNYHGDRCVVYRKTALNVSEKCFSGPIASAKIFYVGHLFQNKTQYEYACQSYQKGYACRYFANDYICQDVVNA